MLFCYGILISFSPTCPSTCSSQTRTCSNGSWNSSFDSSYTASSCTPTAKSCDSSYYPATSTSSNCSSWVDCTEYSVSNKSCVEGSTRYYASQPKAGYYVDHSNDDDCYAICNPSSSSCNGGYTPSGTNYSSTYTCTKGSSSSIVGASSTTCSCPSSKPYWINGACKAVSSTERGCASSHYNCINSNSSANTPISHGYTRTCTLGSSSRSCHECDTNYVRDGDSCEPDVGDSCYSAACGTVADGGTCTSYARCSSTKITSTCNDGSRSTTPGAYSSANQGCYSCSFNGTTVAHGSSVTAYQSASVPYGSSCTSQSRKCTDGTLNGSYQYSSCSVASCTPKTCSSYGLTASPTGTCWKGVTTGNGCGGNIYCYINGCDAMGFNGYTCTNSASTASNACAPYPIIESAGDGYCYTCGTVCPATGVCGVTPAGETCTTYSMAVAPNCNNYKNVITCRSDGTWSGTPSYYGGCVSPTTYTCAAGKYLPANSTSCSSCTAGYYCPGGTRSKSSLIQGRNSCPSGYGNSSAGSDAQSDCYMSVSANKYVKTARDSSATSCPSGYSSSAHSVYYGNTSSCTANSVVCPASGACPATQAGYSCKKYALAEVTYPYTCSYVTATCQSNGTWDVTPGRSDTCTQTHPSCTGCPSGTVAHNGTCTSYNRCSSTKITSTCTNGSRSTTPGAYSSANQGCYSCSGCPSKSSNVAHGGTCLSYSRSSGTTVQCNSAKIESTCNDGDWSPDLGNYDACIVDTPITTCFIAGTQVTMADGSMKNIEDVKIGDKLLGEGGINTVLAYDRPVLGGRHLWSINGGEYFVSDEHPFKTIEGWKSFDPEMTKLEIDLDTTKLKIGDVLITNDGLEEIEDIDYIESEYSTQLYNFSLDGDHTYYANGYLVHNKQDLYVLCNESRSGYACYDYSHGHPSYSVAGCTLNNREDWYTSDGQRCSCCKTSGGGTTYCAASGGCSRTAAGGTCTSYSKSSGTTTVCNNAKITSTCNNGTRSNTPGSYSSCSISSPTPSCFIAGTQVTMADGSKKNIEDVKIGDTVITYNTESNTLEPNKVISPLIHENSTDDMYELTINGNTLKVTMHHRFYVVIPSENDYQCTLSYDWIAAKDLEVGDLLFMQDGSYAQIDDIIHYSNIETVYNLSVENNHNYFVDKGYLVHNAKSVSTLCVDGCYNTQSECDTANGHTSGVGTTCINNCGPDIVGDCCYCAI